MFSLPFGERKCFCQRSETPRASRRDVFSCRHKQIFLFVDAFLQGIIESFLSPSGRENAFANGLRRPALPDRASLLVDTSRSFYSLTLFFKE